MPLGVQCSAAPFMMEDRLHSMQGVMVAYISGARTLTHAHKPQHPCGQPVFL